MKLKYIVFSLIAFFNLSSERMLAQNQRRIFMEIPYFTQEKTLPYIIQSFDNESKIAVIGYCSNLGIVVFELDVELYDNEQELAKCLKKLNLEFNLKTDITTDQLEQICTSKYYRL